MRHVADLDTVARLLRAFPNLVVAATPALTFVKGKGARDILFEADVDRIVLSSCSPQARPNPIEGGFSQRASFSTPASLYEVALAASTIKGVSVSAILLGARSAASTLLGLELPPMPSHDSESADASPPPD
jgi:hypothetical protein